MFDSINKFFYENCIFAKQVKYNSKILFSKVEVFEETIHTDIVNYITQIGYDR